LYIFTRKNTSEIVVHGEEIAVKDKNCIHSYCGHIKRKGLGGYTEYMPTLKCDVGYEIGGVPKNSDCFKLKGR